MLERFDSTSRVAIDYTKGRVPSYVVHETYETGGGVWADIPAVLDVGEHNEPIVATNTIFAGPVGVQSDWSTTSQGETGTLFVTHPGPDRMMTNVVFEWEFWLWSPTLMFSTTDLVDVTIVNTDVIEAVGSFVIEKLHLLTGSIYFKAMARVLLKKLNKLWRTRVQLRCTNDGRFYGYQRCSLIAGYAHILPITAVVTYQDDDVLESLSSLFELID